MKPSIEDKYQEFEKYRRLTYDFFRSYGALNILILLKLLGPAGLLSEVTKYTKGRVGVEVLKKYRLVDVFRGDRSEVIMLTEKGEKIAELLIEICKELTVE
ncbi:MAG: hypothetical protein DRJ37_06165 [Thermoprotei archaeon]|nr:MAG: hypothetical protein DRJ37_06165 [Thermoprotei archaeon]